MYFLTITALGIGFIFLSSTLGAALVYCFKKEFSPQFNAAFLGIASGVMIAASVWSLVLPALNQTQNGWGRYAFIPVSLGFLLGSLLLWTFDKILPKQSKKEGSLDEKTSRLFLAVTLHNIPESLAVGFAFGGAWGIGTKAAFLSALGVAIGIGIQNFPEGAAVSLPMRATLKSKHKAFLYGFASGAVEPLFAVLGCIFAAYLRFLQPWLLAFAAGAMVFVVAQDLLPDTELAGEKGRAIGAWGAVIGFVVMMILDVALS
jgi:ZIP family zinc transporter